MTDHEVVERVAAQPSASRFSGESGAAVRVGSPAASGRHSLDSTTPICPDTGDDVDDCHCIDVRDYDEQDAADDVFQQALDERGED